VENRRHERTVDGPLDARVADVANVALVARVPANFRAH
jgi:hypothetical protein